MLSLDALEKVGQGQLADLWRWHRSSGGVTTDDLEAFLPSVLALSGTETVNGYPRILHVGPESMLAEHFGSDWAADPYHWNDIPDKKLLSAARASLQSSTLDEPNLALVPVRHDAGYAFSCMVYRYLRLMLPVRTPMNYQMVLSLSLPALTRADVSTKTARRNDKAA